MVLFLVSRLFINRLNKLLTSGSEKKMNNQNERAKSGCRMKKNKTHDFLRLQNWNTHTGAGDKKIKTRIKKATTQLGIMVNLDLNFISDDLRNRTRTSRRIDERTELKIQHTWKKRAPIRNVDDKDGQGTWIGVNTPNKNVNTHSHLFLQPSIAVHQPVCGPPQHLCYDLVRGSSYPTPRRTGMTPHPAIYIVRQEHSFTRTPEPSPSPRTGLNSFSLMPIHCEYCTVTVTKNLHMQTCGAQLSKFFLQCKLLKRAEIEDILASQDLHNEAIKGTLSSKRKGNDEKSNENNLKELEANEWDTINIYMRRRSMPNTWSTTTTTSTTQYLLTPLHPPHIGCIRRREEILQESLEWHRVVMNNLDTRWLKYSVRSVIVCHMFLSSHSTHSKFKSYPLHSQL
ncbi:putative signal peptide protein [Puccinia sorghi]|uniref:Putative signal peptide protein n=1 Tax=Puccinia sorghi TaxID=27349 RepID=A0A0L6VQ18_9BASI|nr:putative signal peptide protein [Puccinia sorghi]